MPGQGFHEITSLKLFNKGLLLCLEKKNLNPAINIFNIII